MSDSFYPVTALDLQDSDTKVIAQNLYNRGIRTLIIIPDTLRYLYAAKGHANTAQRCINAHLRHLLDETTV